VTSRDEDIPDLLVEGPRPERSRVALVSVACLVVLVVGAFGVAHLRSQDRPEVLSVAQAASTTTATGSARLTFRAPTAPKVEMVLAGVVDFAHERFALRGTWAGMETELRGIGADQWSRTDQTDRIGRPWVHMTRVDAPGEGIGATEPGRLLHELRTAGTELSRRTRGERTVVVVRAPRSVLGGRETGAVTNIDVEIDREGRIRRVEMDGGESSSPVLVTYDDFGVDVEVEPPPASDVSEFADLLGGSLGATDPELRKQFPDLDDTLGCGLFDEQRKKLAETTSEANRATLDKLLADAKKACETRR
jgi:hypothetical protein